MSHARFRRLSIAGALILLISLLGVIVSGGSSPAAPVDPADLALTKSDSPDPVNQNSELTYTIQVTNNGPDAATNVKVTDDLPGGIEYTSATTTSGSCDKQGNKVECNLGTLNNGASATVTIKVNTKNKQGDISNTASVTSDITDPNSSNNSDTEVTKVLETAGPSCNNKPATIVGTTGSDTLTGTTKRDVILALAGDDQVFALSGNDRICAGAGNDLVSGGADPDFAAGGGGNDLLKGRGGGDELRGKAGNDRLRGNRGPDLLKGGRGFDSCRGGPGSDTLRSCP